MQYARRQKRFRESIVDDQPGELASGFRRSVRGLSHDRVAHDQIHSAGSSRRASGGLADQGRAVWGEIHDVEEPDSPTDLLASFQQAHAQGELDDAEFARVTEKLAGFSSAAGAADFSDRPRDATDSDRIVPQDRRLDKSPASPRDSGAMTES